MWHSPNGDLHFFCEIEMISTHNAQPACSNRQHTWQEKAAQSSQFPQTGLLQPHLYNPALPSGASQKDYPMRTCILPCQKNRIFHSLCDWPNHHLQQESAVCYLLYQLQQLGPIINQLTCVINKYIQCKAIARRIKKTCLINLSYKTIIQVIKYY